MTPALRLAAGLSERRKPMGSVHDRRNFGTVAQSASAPAGESDYVTNMTAEYRHDNADDFDLTGNNINSMGEHGGNADLSIDYVAGTKAVRDTTQPVNTDEPTVNTKNAFCEYRAPAGGTLADVWPSGTGSYFLIARFDSHPDSFNAKDWIVGDESGGVMGANLGIAIADGPEFYVKTNAGAQVNSQAITLDAWHIISVRNGVGAGQLKVQIDDADEVTATGAAVAVLTGRLKRWADSGDAGRADMAQAIERWYSDILTDEQKELVKAALRAQVSDV